MVDNTDYRSKIDVTPNGINFQQVDKSVNDSVVPVKPSRGRKYIVLKDIDGNKGVFDTRSAIKYYNDHYADQKHPRVNDECSSKRIKNLYTKLAFEKSRKRVISFDNGGMHFSDKGVEGGLRTIKGWKKWSGIELKDADGHKARFDKQDLVEYCNNNKSAGESDLGYKCKKKDILKRINQIQLRNKNPVPQEQQQAQVDQQPSQSQALGIEEARLKLAETHKFTKDLKEASIEDIARQQHAAPIQQLEVVEQVVERQPQVTKSIVDTFRKVLDEYDNRVDNVLSYLNSLHEARINITSSEAETMLHNFVSKETDDSAQAKEGVKEVIDKLIEMGADVNAKSSTGETPLHNAVSNGNNHAVSALLLCDGVNVNAEDNDSNTPLHTAVSEGNFQIVEQLLNSGKITDINKLNSSKQTPLDLLSKSEVIPEGGEENIGDMLKGAFAQAFGMTDTQKIRKALQERNAMLGVDTDRNKKEVFDPALMGNIEVAEEEEVEDLGLGQQEVIAVEEVEVAEINIADLNRQQTIDRFNKLLTAWLTNPGESEYRAMSEFVNQITVNQAGYTDDQGRNMLHLAASVVKTRINEPMQQKLEEIVEGLLAKKVVVDAKDFTGNTPLRAALDTDSAVAGILLKRLSSQEIVGKFDELLTTWLKTHGDGDYTVVTNFLKQLDKSHAEHTDDQGRNMLHLAASVAVKTAKDRLMQQKLGKIIESLIEKGVDINAKGGKSEATPLHIAVNAGPRMVSFLLKKLEGKDINIKDKDGNTPLHKAVGIDLEVVKLLIGKGANINEQNAEDSTPLHLAVNSGNSELVNYLSTPELLANVNLRDKNGRTPLHFAVALKDASVSKVMVEKLLDMEGFMRRNRYSLQDIDINLQDNDGNTPLHKAANKGIVELLLTKKAIVQPNKIGKTPFDLAIENENYDLAIVYLEKANLNVDLNTLFHLAVKNKSDRLIDYLLKKNININFQDKIYGNTPLHMAILSNELDVKLVEKLLSMKGIKTNIPNKNGETPLDLVRKMKSEDEAKQSEIDAIMSMLTQVQ